MLYMEKTLGFQHFPGSIMFQFFLTGVHWIHGINAVPPKAIFTEMIINQSKTRVRPSLIRNNVIANDVLLYIAAKIANTPATIPIKPISGRFSGSMSFKFLPKPSEVVTVRRQQSMNKQTLCWK